MGKEEVKVSMFADNLTLYIENPKDATRKLLELINKFGKVAGYKINTQKSNGFIETNNERSERKIKSISPKVRKKTRVPTLTTIIQYSFGSSSYNNQRRKRNRRNPDQK